MPADPAPSGAWAAEQLTAYVAALAGADGCHVLPFGIERIAELLEAEIATVVVDGRVEAVVGFPRGEVPHEQLVTLAEQPTRTAAFSGVDQCDLLAVPFDAGSAGRLLLARASGGEWSFEERNLVRGMARVLALSHQANRSLRALHERQALLERMTRIQQRITSRAPLPDVLEAIVEGARELLGDTIVAFRRICADDPAYAEILSSSGLETDSHLAGRIRVGEGAGGRAIAEGRLVVMNDYAGESRALGQFVSAGLVAAMAAPVREDGVVVGSLVVATNDARRSYSETEQEMLQSFADFASIAVTDARTVESLRQALRAARHDAMHDVLTGLPNRALLRDRLAQASARAMRHRTQTALLFLDLDGFKRVNDSLGHDTGDQLLVAVGERFSTALRGADTVARLGGDEFAVLIEDVAAHGEVDEVAQRLLDTLATPLTVDGREVSVSASIGIALSDSATADVHALLRNADLAMYESKRAGGGRIVRFEPDMHEHTVERLETEVALRQAIVNDELLLHYQPIYDLATGRIVAAEALVRWQHPTRGLISPAAFIPVAESSRLITQIGEWVLRTACEDAVTWPAGMQVAVNVSPRQVDQHLLDTVPRVLAETGLAAERLTLEVTESVAMTDSPETQSVICSLHSQGVQIAIDDFGVGHSSLARLRWLPVNVLKIDRTFVQDLDTGGGVPVLTAILALCHDAGLTAVAEGVETDEQLQHLRALGCDEAQGFLLAMPMPAAELTALLRTGGPLAVPSPRPTYDGVPSAL